MTPVRTRITERVPRREYFGKAVESVSHLLRIDHGLCSPSQRVDLG